MLVYGVVMAIFPTTWAFFGNFTDVVGFHNSQSLAHFDGTEKGVLMDRLAWEFYMRNAWNFMTA